MFDARTQGPRRGRNPRLIRGRGTRRHGGTHGQGPDGRGALLLPRRGVVREGTSRIAQEGAGARARQRPAEVRGRLGRGRVRQAPPARGRLGLLSRQRARVGVRPPRRAPGRPGLPLPRPCPQSARLDPLHADPEAQAGTDIGRRRDHSRGGRQAAPPGPRPRPDRARRRQLGRGRAPRPRRRAGAARGRLPLHRPHPRPRGAHAPQQSPRRAARAGGPPLRPAERARDLQAPGGLRPRDEEPGDALPVARAAAHASPPQPPRPRRERHRDLDRRAEHRRRQADLPDHGRAPRARVALGGAHARVRLRPRRGLRARPEDDGAAPADAHDRRAGREQRRLQHLARGGDARRLHAVRLRDEAQELRHRGRDAGEVRAWRLRRQQGRSPARERT